MIPLHKVYLPPAEELMPALETILYSGQITEGEAVREFETRFAAHFGTAPVLSFYSATAALHIALVLSEVEQGDEVISTPVTVEPTNMAVLHAGARIVWADVDPDTGNIDPESVARLMTKKTRAIMAVHYEGRPAPLARLRIVAGDVPIVEDAAHALGARMDGMAVGRNSDFAVFSLQAIKHMTTVDGGMMAVSDDALRERGRRIRWFGIDRAQPRLEQRVTDVGYKYHMNNVNATIGLVQLNHVDRILRRHRENGEWLDGAMAEIPGLAVPPRGPECLPSYWHHVVLAERRDDFIAAMRSRGVEAGPGIVRNDLHPVFGKSPIPLPGVDAFTRRMALLPCGWWVSDEDREKIREAARRGW